MNLCCFIYDVYIQFNIVLMTLVYNKVFNNTIYGGVICVCIYVNRHLYIFYPYIEAMAVY